MIYIEVLIFSIPLHVSKGTDNFAALIRAINR